jgi:predicted Na+-dependent transporter
MPVSFSAAGRWLDKRMFILVLVALVLGFFTRLPGNPVKAVVLLFAYMTFAASVTASLRQFARTLLRPWLPLWLLALIHIFCPVFVWGLSFLFYPAEQDVRIGYLIAAAIPIGVTSLVWTAMLKGDLALSLAAVTLDAIVTPVLLPLYFRLVIGHLVAIDYWAMVVQMLWMVTLPSLAGMALYDWTGGRIAAFGEGIGGLSAKIAFLAVIFINASVLGPQIVWSLALLKMAAVTFVMAVAGYAAGYFGSLILHRPSRGLVLTMVYNVGLRNVSFGLVVALSYFPPLTAIPIMLLILFQQPLAAAIPALLRRPRKA